MASPLKGYHSPLLKGLDLRPDTPSKQPEVLERLIAIEVELKEVSKRVKNIEDKGVGNGGIG